MGEPDVDRLLARIDGVQLAEWRAWAQAVAQGPEFDDARHAMLMALLANAHRDTKTRPRPFEPADFLLGTAHAPERPRMTPRAFRAQFAHLVKKAS